MIEELAEQREPRVERRRKAFVRRDVGQLDVVAFAARCRWLRAARREVRRAPRQARRCGICGSLRGGRRSRRVSKQLPGSPATGRRRTPAARLSARAAPRRCRDGVLQRRMRNGFTVWYSALIVIARFQVRSPTGGSMPARCSATMMAAGLSSVWSTIRLEIVRRLRSITIVVGIVGRIVVRRGRHRRRRAQGRPCPGAVPSAGR